MITNNISEATTALVNNEIIAMPTETVYGLAGNAYSVAAVQKIFTLKKRPSNNPLIVHIKSVQYLNNVANDIPLAAYKLASAFWPGSLTLVLKKQLHIPDIVTAGKTTVAVRVPNHPVALALLESLSFPLAAPSANPFGCISPTTAEHVHTYFGNDLPIILQGGSCENGVESTIIGFDNEQPILYRHGAISVEDIEAVVGKIIVNTNNNSNPVAPGMLSRHYAPSTPTYLTENVSEMIQSTSNKKIGVLVFKNKITNESITHQEILSITGNTKEATKNLYAALHRLDNSDAEIIIAEKMPAVGLGKTINDRLQRAVKK